MIASATEIVCALGLEGRLVGISHECDHPASILDRPRLSRTKVDPRAPSAAIDRTVRELVRDGLSVYEIDVDRLQLLAPDVIVTQDQCAVCAVSLSEVEAACRRLARPETRVVSCKPEVLEDVYADIRKVGAATGTEDRAQELVTSMRRALHDLSAAVAERPRPTVVCVEWIEPVMVAGGWMPELVRIAGGEPLIVTGPSRFRQVTWDDVRQADPDAVVVMPCGFPLAQSRTELAQQGKAHAHLGDLRATREGRTWLADGNAFFNRPGPRLVDSARQLARILHPDLFPEDPMVERWNAV